MDLGELGDDALAGRDIGDEDDSLNLVLEPEGDDDSFICVEPL